MEIVIDPGEEVQDYRFLNKSIPKNGAKDFEPDGSISQALRIQESKKYMYEVLLQPLRIHEKVALVGIYVKREAKTVVVSIKGTHFKDIGVNQNLRGQPIVILNKVETLFLLERGSLVLYLGNDKFLEYLDGTMNSYSVVDLLPMSLQHFYGELASLELREYQVFSYLKRLGYLIQDFRCLYPQKPPLKRPFVGVRYFPDFKKHHHTSYASVLAGLAVVSHHTFSSPTTALRIKYNVWKPRPAFSKKNPPPPDFQLAIVDDMPPVEEIHALFGQLNEVPLQPTLRGGRTVVLAMVDNGVGFVSLAEADFRAFSTVA